MEPQPPSLSKKWYQKLFQRHLVKDGLMQGDSLNVAPPQKENIFDFIRVVVEALLIALLIKTFAFQPFNIPSGSMIPTLLIGDYVFVSKFAYGYSKHSFPLSMAPFSGRIWRSEPKRGDVVVFKLPRDPQLDYIKRLIGLPGDRIQMIKGRLYINGEMVKKELDGASVQPDEFGREKEFPRYKETLPNGVSYHVIEISGDGAHLDNTNAFIVPQGHYFMMGDNRDNSTDSRDQSLKGVGFVPDENLVGRAEIVFFSWDGVSPLRFWEAPTAIRPDRLIKKVQEF